MTKKFWLRVKLPETDVRSLQQEFSNCELRQGDDASIDPQWLPQVNGVFTEAAIPDELDPFIEPLNFEWLSSIYLRALLA